MFTGIVETTGILTSVDTASGRMRLATKLAPRLHVGQSIAVNGACLTVTRKTARAFDVDVSPETFARTSFGALRPGARVNLERALSAHGRLEGHFLQGHVDATGRMVGRKDEGEFARLRFSYPKTIAPYLIPKGSIGVHGVSLTIASMTDRHFEVALIPVTLDVTNLGSLAKGSPVNLEGDMIGKYVVRFLELSRPPRAR